ncbi:MAG: enoyl-CoA hydratase-related protein [Acidimicrobiales bacterium]
MYSEILYEVHDPVATVTLNRPEARNAWTPTMEMELRDALTKAVDDPAVVGIVLTGAGRGFCAGIDLRLLEAYSAGDRDVLVADHVGLPGEEWSDDLRGPYTFLLSVPKPVIAAINGPVAGMALAIILACDLRFIAEGARLSTTFAERGLVAEYGLGWLLPKLVGPAVAMDLMLSARTVTGPEAVELGLANRAVPGDELLDTARAYVADLAARCSPASMATMKRQVYTHLHAGLGAAEQESRRFMLESFERPDAAEGVRSFLKKRPPRFPRLGRTKEVV